FLRKCSCLSHSQLLALCLPFSSCSSWRPPQTYSRKPLSPMAGLEPQCLDQLGPFSHYQMQMGSQGSSHIVADLSKKQVSWMGKEEAPCGWTDFGCYGAKQGDQHP
uniref:Uncharacterized protein n=1 Tax=Spermophilus dauricus TaxID=99837 RepID=A0A8C9PDE1_SPEDA